MKTAYFFAAIVAVAALAVGIYMVDRDQTQDVNLPDADMSAQGGIMPEHAAETGDIGVGHENAAVTGPTAEIERPQGPVADNG